MTLEILALVAAVIGIVGSIVPGLPGPPVSWLGLLFVFLSAAGGSGAESLSTASLMVWLAVVTAVTVLDYLLPARFTAFTGGHKAASTGAIIGLFAGMFIPPVGMILGSVLGAFLAEFLVEDQGVWNSFKASIGDFVGFIVTTGMKLIVSGIMAYKIFTLVF